MKDRLLTSAETAKMLGYKHLESFRRAVRRGNLIHIYPWPDLTQQGHPWMFKMSDVEKQARHMPRLGRPLEGTPTLKTSREE